MNETSYRCCKRSHWDITAIITVLLLSAIALIAVVDHYSKTTADEATHTVHVDPNKP